MLRVLVVDDEPPARRRVRALLAPHADVVVAAECADGAEALDAIVRQRPDIVFLDVQMPRLDGFEVLQNVDAAARPPAVVFVTAFDAYAVRAFEVHAVDYLLKPYASERFDAALQRARDRLRRSAGRPAVDALLAHVRRDRAAAGRLAVKVDSGLEVVRFADIDWLEADGNYVALHLRGRTLRVRDTLANFEERLAGAAFLRIHRSAIVAVDRIARLEPWWHGEFVVFLHDGTRFVASRTYAPALRALLVG